MNLDLAPVLKTMLFFLGCSNCGLLLSNLRYAHCKDLQFCRERVPMTLSGHLYLTAGANIIVRALFRGDITRAETTLTISA